MLARTTALNSANPAAVAALLVAAGGAATILGAWFFQYVIGLSPCPLCLEQRVPYYVGIPLAVIVAIAALWHAPRGAVIAGLGLLVLAMLIGAALGVYHAGVEWHWWVGPTDCSGPLTPLGGGKDLTQDLANFTPVRCDQAQWRFLGLSLAGYNVLISLALAAIALWGIAASSPRRAAEA